MYALRDTAFGFFAYESDGTARSDSARRFAAAGMWDIEGGDRQRGIRLVQAALRLDVTDLRFYRDALEVMKLLHCPTEAVVLVEQIRQRWPQDRWADSVYAPTVHARDRATTAEQPRVCPLRVGETAPDE